MLQIPGYSGKVVEKRRRRKAITKRFAFQVNATTFKWLLHWTWSRMYIKPFLFLLFTIKACSLCKCLVRLILLYLNNIFSVYSPKTPMSYGVSVKMNVYPCFKGWKMLWKYAKTYGPETQLFIFSANLLNEYEITFYFDLSCDVIYSPN